MLDQRRASPTRDCPRLLPCADRAWSSMISHVEQRSSRRESRGWFFFFGQGSSSHYCFIDIDRECVFIKYAPIAQLLPGLETGHPVTVGQSPAYDFSVSDEQKAVFLVSVSDCSECDSYAGDWPTVTGCPVSNPGNNCANGLFVWAWPSARIPA